VNPIPHEAPAGFHWEVGESHHLDWSLDAWQIGQRRCRFSDAGVRCANIAAVVLHRYSWNGRSQPWAYCADHMYGRWIEDGRVLEWKLRRDDGLSGGAALAAGNR